jgi:hypothetical protein
MLRLPQMLSSTCQSCYRSQPRLDFVAGLEAGAFSFIPAPITTLPPAFAFI